MSRLTAPSYNVLMALRGQKKLLLSADVVSATNDKEAARRLNDHLRSGNVQRKQVAKQGKRTVWGWKITESGEESLTLTDQGGGPLPEQPKRPYVKRKKKEEAQPAPVRLNISATAEGLQFAAAELLQENHLLRQTLADIHSKIGALLHEPSESGSTGTGE